ncbi:porin family protein [uncultured Flavobacterium sp.]|uniref:porin family protein n=1 Tax=uncultured Flavobacterium sp. TaxID=165435 RepID=UPI0025F5E095|nr:porin family protein [uncultured Flavobacterium sp.]
MKKIILTVSAIFAMGVLNAQEIKYGVKAGLNLSTLTGDITDFTDVKSKAGFHVGGFVEFKFTDKFAIQPELLYSTQGAKSEFFDSDDVTFQSEEDNYKLDYLNLPIMAKYYVAPGFSIEAGPQIGFLLSAKNKYDYTSSFFGEDLSDSGEEDVKDSFKSIDFGVNFGAGYEFTQNIFVQARYNLGLSNIADFDNDFEIKNSVVQVSFGYKF